MRVIHQSATISFCPDLTDPEATSIPVATLLVGAADGLRFAAVSAFVPASAAGLDPISAHVLLDVPTLLKEHVDAVLESLPEEAPIEEILVKLHRRLRNSLHVAKISEPVQAELPVGGTTNAEAADQVAGRLLEIAVDQMHDAAQQSRPRASGPSRPATSMGANLRGGMPSRAVWPLHPHAPRSALRA